MHLGMKNPSFKGFKIALLAVLFTVAAAFNPRPFAVDDEGVNIIVIDPGHGGKDPGNLGTGRYKDREKDVSYDVLVVHSSGSTAMSRANAPGTPSSAPISSPM